MTAHDVVVFEATIAGRPTRTCSTTPPRAWTSSRSSTVRRPPASPPRSLGSRAAANASLYALLDPAVQRFAALADDDAREAFRAALTAFVRIYAFLAQIVPFADAELEQLYTYSRFLALRLPHEQPAGLDLSDDVILTHLRTELTGEHDLSLTEGGWPQHRRVTARPKHHSASTGRAGGSDPCRC